MIGSIDSVVRLHQLHQTHGSPEHLGTMENIGTFPIQIDPFSTGDDELDAEWKQLAKELIGENEEETEAKVEQFRSAVLETASLRDLRPGASTQLDQKYCVRFLRAANWSVVEAVNLVTLHYKMCHQYPQFTSSKSASQIDQIWQSKLNGCSLKRDQHGRRLYFYRIHKWDADKITMQDLFNSKTILFDTMIQEQKTQVAGITMVYDVKGFEAKHLGKWGLDELRFFGEFISGGFPVWIRNIHIVNNPRLLDVLYKLIKPFLGKRIRNSIIFHGSNLNSLHKMVPLEMLPEDLGGEEGDLNNDDSVRAALEREEDFRQYNATFLKQ